MSEIINSCTRPRPRAFIDPRRVRFGTSSLIWLTHTHTLTRTLKFTYISFMRTRVHECSYCHPLVLCACVSIDMKVREIRSVYVCACMYVCVHVCVCSGAEQSLRHALQRGRSLRKKGMTEISGVNYIGSADTWLTTLCYARYIILHCIVFYSILFLLLLFSLHLFYITIYFFFSSSSFHLSFLFFLLEISGNGMPILGQAGRQTDRHISTSFSLVHFEIFFVHVAHK